MDNVTRCPPASSERREEPSGTGSELPCNHGVFGSFHWPVSNRLGNHGGLPTNRRYEKRIAGGCGAGIAEALIATAAGLAAAIPAVIFYNYFLGRINTISGEMDNFSSELINIIERIYWARK